MPIDYLTLTPYAKAAYHEVSTHMVGGGCCIDELFRQ